MCACACACEICNNMHDTNAYSYIQVDCEDDDEFRKTNNKRKGKGNEKNEYWLEKTRKVNYVDCM